MKNDYGVLYNLKEVLSYSGASNNVGFIGNIPRMTISTTNTKQ
jgi:hypothetical protein